MEVVPVRPASPDRDGSDSQRENGVNCGYEESPKVARDTDCQTVGLVLESEGDSLTGSLLAESACGSHVRVRGRFHSITG